ncbi:MAG: sulfatase-like hydrolase/transferase [Alphaproteobacteria bacterium]|nr:sulfatase-like hydrolase/transferase [Alphaproteobacteria bacterium]
MSDAQKSPQPNFVLIMTDQHRADHLGCYGNPVVKTTNIDALAAGGVAFDKFYVATPVCMPNRAALMTGRMPSANGARHNGFPLSTDSVTFVDLLKAAGYRTALVGKSHIQNMTGRPSLPPSPLNPDFIDPPEELQNAVARDMTGPAYQRESLAAWKADPDREIETPHYGFDHVRLVSGHGDLVEGHYTAWLRDKGGDAAELVGPDNALPDQQYSAPQAWRTKVPEELYPTSYIAEEALAYLQNHSAENADEPFFLKVSFPDPHHPFTPPGHYWGMYDPGDVAPPATFDNKIDDPLPRVPELAQALLNEHKNPMALHKVSEFEAQSAIALNYGMITMIDDAVGRIVAQLKALGLDDNTVILFTSDHGDFMGDRGVLFKFGMHYQELIRVPLVWRDPQRGDGGSRSARVSGTIDIAASVLARAGLNPYFGMQGINVFDDTREHLGMMVEDYTANYVLDPRAGAHFSSLVTDRWRMSHYETSDWGELYDLQEDPQERHNLWDDASAAADKARLHEIMVRELLILRDKPMAPPGRA